MIPDDMTFLTLDSGWTLTADNPESAPEELRKRLTNGIPATVPGEASVDLLRAGLIADPFDADNEASTLWVGDVDWRYECRFDWHDNGRSRHDLVALGVDTLASVVLNGRRVDAVGNAFLAYRWDVRNLLVEGENILVVQFTSPVRASDELEHRRGYYPHAERFAFNQIRKPAYGFGWDWGIAVPGSGLWRPIRIESWSVARVHEVRPLARVDDQGRGVLQVFGTVEREGAGRVRDMLHPHGGDHDITLSVTVTRGDLSLSRNVAVPSDRSAFDVEITVEHPELWWPAGYGEHPLYDVDVTPVNGDGTPVFGGIGWHGRIGFRTITADTAIDSVGRPFRLVVNGQPIHARGYNWIPASAFVSQVTDGDYRRLMRDVAESNSNMLRVWGGGIYESDTLYDLADEQGILIWQDFMFACAMYPQEPDMVAQVEAEAREQIIRLSPHASLAVWNGSNENYVAYAQWDEYRSGLRDDDREPDRYGGREKPWGDLYYDTIIPGLLERLDPTRIYLPSSPMSFNKHAAQSSDVDGTIHIWDVWNSADYRKYADYTPRFADEFGYQGPPAFSTLTRVVHDVPMDPFSPQMLAHQKAVLGNIKIARGMRSHLTPGSFDDMTPDEQGWRRWLIDTDQWNDIEDWHWAAQLQQAQAVRFAVEHMRSLEPVNDGILIWQINDDWPVISWAAVDYDGHRKPLWYVSRQTFAPRFATIRPGVSASRRATVWPGIVPGPDRLILHVINDGMADYDTEWTVRRMKLDGSVLAETTMRCLVSAHQSAHLELPGEIADFGDAADEIIVAETSEGFSRAVYNPVDVIGQRLCADAFDARVESGEQGYLLHVTARSYVRDLFCMADKVHPEAGVNDGMVDLLPGESLVWRIDSPKVDEPSLFAAGNVLRSANDLRHL